jgi:hypothetical protein
MNHSHGYEMRLQKAVELKMEEARKREQKREKREHVENRRDALVQALKMLERLPKLLAAYEATGDHDHGHGPIVAGSGCSGGDCLVAKARHFIQTSLR